MRTMTKAPPEEQTARVRGAVTAIVIAGNIATFVYLVYLARHANALVFTTRGEYSYSNTVRWLGTWGLTLTIPLWGALLWATRHHPRRSVRRAGAVSSVLLAAAILVNAVAFLAE